MENQYLSNKMGPKARDIEKKRTKNNMESNKNSIIKSYKKNFFIGLIVIFIIFSLLLFFSACLYYILIDDGTWGKYTLNQQNETKIAKISINAKINYVKAQYSEAIGSDIIDISSNFEYIIDDKLKSIGYDVEEFASIEEKIQKLGLEEKLNLDTCTVAQLLWESNDVFEKYLDDAEELEHLINAELITQYPDIDGKTYEQSKFLDGIIKFCRPEVLGEGKYLQYVSEDKFRQLIDNYESTGDETVLKHFTIVDDSEGGKVARIAYGEKEIVEIKNNDDDYKDLGIDFREPTTIYTIYTKDINYKELACVDKYTLVFNYLWAFLVISENYDLAKEMADLAYNSEIEITIYDSTSTYIDVDAYNYNRQDYNYYNAKFNNEEEENSYTRSGSENIITKNCYIEYTITNIINKVDVILTKADVWVVNYTNNASSTGSGDSQTKSNSDFNEIVLGTQRIGSNDTEYKNWVRTQKQEGYEDEYIYAQKTNKIVDIKYTNIYTTNTKSYITNVATVTEKIEDFVELLSKYGASKGVILEISSWLIEILENNENTARLVDLTKYILNKATDGRAYSNEEITIDWKTLLEFDEFSDFTNGIYGGTVEEKVWYTLKSYGFSDYAVAGVMGNIKAESGFRTGAVEAGNNNEGNGLCQWSYGRKTQLKSYAESKGVEWTDADTQIEFMITEIMGTGPAQGYANKQWSNSSYNAWKNANSASEAAEIFCNKFERPGIPHMENRKRYAEEFYEKYKGKAINESLEEYKEYKVIPNAVEFCNYTYKNKFYQSADKSKWNDSCLGFSQVYCAAIKSKKFEIIKNQPGLVKGNSPKLVSGISYKAVSDHNKDTILSKIYNIINSGNPCVLQVNGNKAGTSRHYVSVIGYKSTVLSASAIKEEDLLILDVWSGKIQQLNGRGSGSRFMIKGSETTVKGRTYGYQIYMFK